MDKTTLYSCRPNNEAPDWSKYDWLEIVPVLVDDDGEHGGVDEHEANQWTVFGHMPNAGLDDITDCTTRQSAEAVAAELGRISGLEVR